MGLQAGQYNLQCWNSTSNPSEINRPHLLYQCMQLIKALQQRFTNGEIAIPSSDAKPDRKGIEICIFYRAGADLFADVASFLTDTAARLGLDYTRFVKQDAGLTRYFDQQAVDNISLLAKPVPDDLTEEAIAKALDQAASFSLNMNDAWRDGIPADQRAKPFLIPRSTLRRFHQKEGNDLATEVEAVMDAIAAKNAELKSSTSLIVTLAKGAMWLGGTALVGSELSGSAACIMILWAAGFTGAAIASAGVLIGVLAAFAGKSRTVDYLSIYSYSFH
jgi:hypothetical protein